MKIRFIIQNPPSLGFGGGHIQGLMYSKYLQRIGIDAKFIDYTSLKDDFDILHVLGMQAGNALNAISGRAQGKKIVLSPIFYTEANVALYSMVKKIAGYKYFNFFQNRFYLMQALIDVAEVALPNSEAECLQMKKIFGVEQRKSRIVFNGIEPDFFSGVDGELFRNQYGIKGEYVLCVANINRRKNTLGLIEAFIASDIPATLVLVGNYTMGMGGYSRTVEDAISKNKGRVVRISGLHYGDTFLKSAYIGAKMHVLPSILETPGLANLEAGLAGCNLVVGDCPPTREYFESLARFCTPDDVSDIAQKIKEAYNTPRSDDVSKKILERYSWEIIADQLKTIYSSL